MLLYVSTVSAHARPLPANEQAVRMMALMQSSVVRVIHISFIFEFYSLCHSSVQLAPSHSTLVVYYVCVYRTQSSSSRWKVDKERSYTHDDYQFSTHRLSCFPLSLRQMRSPRITRLDEMLKKFVSRLISKLVTRAWWVSLHVIIAKDRPKMNRNE